MKKKILANDIKKLVAKYVFAKFGDVKIASEVMYGSSRRVVDMAFIYKENIYAIEIKSEADNTSRLKGQLSEYEKIFDYILVFTSPNHINEVSQLVNEKIGVYSVDREIINQNQRPRKNTDTDKYEMLSTIPSSYIKKELDFSGALDSDEIRKRASKVSKQKIHDMLISHMYNIFSKRSILPTI